MNRWVLILTRHTMLWWITRPIVWRTIHVLSLMWRILWHFLTRLRSIRGIRWIGRTSLRD